jgi:hypothetical protein
MPRRNLSARAGLSLAFIVSILFGALSPRGYMPSFEGGRIAIEICTEEGARTVEVDAPGGKQAPGPTQNHGLAKPCLYAGVGSTLIADAPPPPSALLFRPAHAAPPRPSGPAAGLRSPFDPNAPPQAPPRIFV